MGLHSREEKGSHSVPNLMFDGLKSRRRLVLRVFSWRGGSRFEPSSERSDVELLELVELVRYLTSVDWTAIQSWLYVAFFASVLVVGVRGWEHGMKLAVQLLEIVTLKPCSAYTMQHRVHPIIYPKRYLSSFSVELQEVPVYTTCALNWPVKW
jgi:hypothetical protein